jgi:hypothetical protein
LHGKINGISDQIDAGGVRSIALNSEVPHAASRQCEKLERGFAEAEASLFLSGMKLSEFGLRIQTRILAGEITIERGRTKSLHLIELRPK